ncbi:hypothetical protein [Paracoccus sp. (in: a-proteobacteria)]|uniref:hypothetical protein n=1 Tax=Paracoccus sp. TaxID=267 RepID=UPI0028AFDD03|nr:hypothetical protein [Paracoccus sp. (in: a-proteobacteria)]
MIADMFAEGLGVQGASGCCDICGVIAGIGVLAGLGFRALLTTCIRLCGRVLGGSCRHKWLLLDGVLLSVGTHLTQQAANHCQGIVNNVFFGRNWVKNAKRCKIFYFQWNTACVPFCATPVPHRATGFCAICRGVACGFCS